MSILVPPHHRILKLRCITDVSPGDHTFTCEGFQVDMRVPGACQAPRCGIILDLRGDTGTGPLEDAHTKLRDLGE